jgi:hypothetical protein
MRAALLVFASLLVATSSARAAENAPPTRVVLLDAVILTPALERSNARLGLEQGVMTALREHGWEPVSVTTNCKDLSCAAAVAETAKTFYALILSGRFVQGETYVADVGVSLWRDGTVVATRTEVDEEAAAQKAGQEDGFVRCGPPGGACTSKILEAKLKQYSAKLADDEMVSIAAKKVLEREAAAKAAATVTKETPLPASALPTSSRQNESHSGATRTAGWSLVIGGGLLIGSAVALWTQNNSETDCHSDGCRRQRRTLGAALATGIGGIVAAGAGVTLFLTTSSSSTVALSVHDSGVVLGGTF